MIERITLLVCRMIKRNPVIDNLMGNGKSEPNVTVLYAWVHTKVCCYRHDEYFVIEGSGNAGWERIISIFFANSQDAMILEMKLFTDSKLKKYWYEKKLSDIIWQRIASYSFFDWCDNDYTVCVGLLFAGLR
jgi:hypothetical protein